MPVAAGPPAGGVKVAVSLTTVPGATVVLLVEAWVVRPLTAWPWAGDARGGRSRATTPTNSPQIRGTDGPDLVRTARRASGVVVDRCPMRALHPMTAETHRG